MLGSKNDIFLQAPYGSDRDGTSLQKVVKTKWDWCWRVSSKYISEYSWLTHTTRMFHSVTPGQITSSWFNKRWKEAWLESESKRKQWNRKDSFFMDVFSRSFGSLKTLSCQHITHFGCGKTQHTSTSANGFRHWPKRSSWASTWQFFNTTNTGCFTGIRIIIMVSYKPPYNWVGFHPLYTAMKTLYTAIYQKPRSSTVTTTCEVEILTLPSWNMTWALRKAWVTWVIWPSTPTGLSFRETCSLGIMRRFHQCCLWKIVPKNFKRFVGNVHQSSSVSGLHIKTIIRILHCQRSWRFATRTWQRKHLEECCWKMSFNKSWVRSNFAIYPSKSLEPYEEHRRHTRKTHDQALTNGENLFLVRTCQSATTRSHWFFSQEHVEMRLTKLRELTLFWLTSIGVVVLAVLVGLKDYDIPVLCLCHFLKDTKLQTV